MKLRTLNRWAIAFGFDLRRMLNASKSLPRYAREYVEVKRIHGGDWPISPDYPQLADYYEQAGTASGHYFHQDLYVARSVFEHDPDEHLDIGSRFDGFVAHLATFRRVKVADIRSLEVNVPNVEFVQLDLGKDAPISLAADSVSCLHALEHFGLGRYGDPLSATSWADGLSNLRKLVRPGGRLYLSVPIGPQRIEFNAHRVFAPATVLKAADELGLVLDRFAWVDDLGSLHDEPLERRDIADLADKLKYGLGIFTFQRPANC